MRNLAAFICTVLIFIMPALLWAGTTSDQEKLKEVQSYFQSELSEEDYWRTDELLVTATGSQKPVHLAPSVASVITKEEIEEMGATTLDEALESVPGLHVAPSNWNRLNATFSIRGIHTKENPQVLLLLDGVPVIQNMYGSRPMTFNMSTANISRVEVIRGPGSAIHGADAFAGTINVITKDRHEIDGTIAAVRAGSFGATDTWLQHGDNYGGWDVALSLDFLRNDGDTDRIIDADLQSSLDQVFGTSASLAPGPLETDDRIWDVHLGLAKDNWTVKFWGWQQNNGGNGAGVGQILDPVGNDDADIFQGDITYGNTTILKNWDFSLHFNYFYLCQDSLIKIAPDKVLMPIGVDGNIDFANPVGVTFFPDGVIGNPSGVENTYAMDFTTFYEGFNQHLLRFSTGYKYLDIKLEEAKNFGPGVLDGANFKPVQNGTLTDVTGTPDIYMEDTSREIWHVSLQDEWSFARKWELTGGVRLDHYSDFGFTFNPRVAFVWEPRYDLTTKLLYGRAFRPPSFSENYMKNNPLSLGNEDLDPETIDTLEFAFYYQPTNSLHTILSLFAYEIDDLIEHLPDTGQTTQTAQNAKNQEGHGFEIELDWDITNTFRLRSNFAYQRSKDEESGEIVPDAPAMQFCFNPHWEFLPDWSLDGQYYWIGKRNRANGDTRPDIKNNDVINLTLRRKNIAKHWDFAMAARNLLNENVREPSQASIPNDYPMGKRAIWAELRYAF